MLAQARDTAYLYTYLDKPPFIVDQEKKVGLYFDLAKRMTALSERYRFSIVLVPRKRLDHIIEQNQLDGVVLGANPLWFGDMSEDKFLWLPPYYADRDEFVSLKSCAFEFTGSDSLNNKVIAAVAGYYYVGINEAVSKGDMRRIDTVGERAVLQLIEKKRADVGLVSASVFKYLKKHGLIGDEFYLSDRPHDTFNRRAFTSLSNTQLHTEVARLLEAIKADGSWQKMLRRYQ